MTLTEDNYRLLVYAMNDSTLSLQAKGMFAIMIAEIGDSRYVYKKAITKSSNGRDSERSATAELLDKGYLLKTHDRVGGQFAKVKLTPKKPDYSCI